MKFFRRFAGVWNQKDVNLNVYFTKEKYNSTCEGIAVQKSVCHPNIGHRTAIVSYDNTPEPLIAMVEASKVSICSIHKLTRTQWCSVIGQKVKILS